MNFYRLLAIFTTFCATSLYANEVPKIDTAIMVDNIDVTTIKQGMSLYRQPVAASTFSQHTIERRGAVTTKDLALVVPNLHIPDYGSRTTSSIYIRGLGARIDQPVMGLNIDNVPYLNKNAFDMDVMDIERVEVLRGPQSTLYGRNTMGGVMNIYTISPFNYEGTRLSAEYSSGNTYRLKAAHYTHHSDKLASAFSAYYNSSDGLIKNSYNSQMCDTEQGYGVRAKLDYRANSALRIENTTSASNLEQGGYPYSLMELGEVYYNDPSSYERITVSTGTTIKYSTENYSIASITGYQYLDDDMRLDNDFTNLSYFTLQQAIKEHSITEDIIFRTQHSSPYNFVMGAFGFFKNQNMWAPVLFKEDGIQALILDNANQYLAPNAFVWGEDSFALNSDFTNNTFGGAIYHESTYESGRWRATLGARVDIEQATLAYRNFTNTFCDYLSSGGEVLLTKEIDIDNSDKCRLNFVEFLPKASILYRATEDNRSTIYASISKGYKAGGFNTQIFSDILQQQVMKEFGISLSDTYDVDEVISYEPEHSWNYEIGSHLESREGNIIGDITLFYIDCRNQQLTVFPEGETTGRMMTNAGKSRSYGAELSLSASLSERLAAVASYGYTNAKFTHYIDGKSDYSGNYVPYAPQHTIFAEITYSVPLAKSWGDSIIFGIDTKGAGRTYWNEDNTRSQPLYALLNASICLRNPSYSLTLWGKNLCNKEYDTFYFKSIGNEFTQWGKPLTIGATITINI